MQSWARQKRQGYSPHLTDEKTEVQGEQVGFVPELVAIVEPKANRTSLLRCSSFCPASCLSGVTVSREGCEEVKRASSKSPRTRCLGLDVPSEVGDSSPQPGKHYELEGAAT